MIEDVDGDARLRVALLGTLRVSRGGTGLAVPGARLHGLVARLALAGGRAVEPGVLIDAVWGESPPAGPAHALQSLVSRLRRYLGAADAVEQVAGGYRLAVDTADVDVLRFERLAADGRARLRAGEPAIAAELLGEAAAVWGDRAGSEPVLVAAVAAAAATRLARASVDVVVDLAEAELALGRADDAASRLAVMLAEDPVQERAAGVLMDALAVLGREAEALGLYERVRAATAEVLGTGPGAALRERHLRLLRGGSVPPPAAVPGVAPSGRGLPQPVTGFVGREDDLDRIGALLATGRLVSVVGPGGVGKTRTAVEAARRLPGEDTWFVDLAAVTDPHAVGAAVLAATGARGGRPETRGRGEEEPVGVLADRFAGRCGLLLIDNCEHVIDAVAHLVTAVLARCAGLRVLATSREPLAVDGEALVPLGPLPLPDPEQDVAAAARTASVRLFVERAAAVRPGFVLDAATLPDVVRVVRGLDGLALALELAAARLRTLSLPELTAGLSDRFGLLHSGSRTAPARHRTLTAVIEWSWQLLEPAERTVADHVAVLPGGVTAASAAAVCAGTGVSPGEVPELLARLVDRSLLQLAPESGRYRMLETLREYGVGRLAVAGDLDVVLDLAADHVAEVVARHDAGLRGPDQQTALRGIGAEYANALAALRRRCDAGDAAAALALALDLTWYWQLLGRRADAAQWLGSALAVPGADPSPERDCAHAVHLFSRIDTGGATPDRAAVVGGLADRLPRHPTLRAPHGALAAGALAFLGQERAALAVLDRLVHGDDVWLAGLAHAFRAEIAENAGELDTVRTDVDAALDCFARAGDRWARGTVLPLRAQLCQYADELDDALADLDEAHLLAEEFGVGGAADDVFTGLLRIDLHLRRDDPDRALRLLGSVREQARRAERPELAVFVDAREADVRLRLGDLGRAESLLDAAAAAAPGGQPYFDDHVRTLIGTTRARLLLARDAPDAAQAALEHAYAAALAARDRPITALVAVGVAALADARGQHRYTAFLLGAAARLRGAHDRSDRLTGELTARARRALGEDAVAAAFARGRQLSSGSAVVEIDPARRPSDGVDRR